MEDVKVAQALKNELQVMSKVLEETDTRGNRIRTICRISVEFAPDLPKEIRQKVERVYVDALDDLRHILSF